LVIYKVYNKTEQTVSVAELKGIFIMALDSLADAFYDELCDIYHAEKQLLKALPKMIKKATANRLVEALSTHLEETKNQVERVKLAFEETDRSPKAKQCDAMAGLIEEAIGMMDQESQPEVMDAVIIGLAQKVEHYEIASYGTLCTWATSLGYSNAKEQLGENLAEEEHADETLTKVSKSVNKAAQSVNK
jgi:ferritin-like metal-binding protein YciE